MNMYEDRDIRLVELLEKRVPYDELTDSFGYCDEEIQEACYYISHTPPEMILEMLEEAALLREE